MKQFPSREELRVIARDLVIKHGCVNRAIEELSRLPGICKLPEPRLRAFVDFEGAIDMDNFVDTTRQLTSAIGFLAGDAVSDGNVRSDYSEDLSGTYAHPAEALQVIYDILKTPVGSHDALECIHWDQLVLVLSRQPYSQELFDSLNKLLDCALTAQASDQAFQVAEKYLRMFQETRLHEEDVVKALFRLARAAILVRKDLLSSFGKQLVMAADVQPALKAPLESWLARKSVADVLSSQ